MGVSELTASAAALSSMRIDEHPASQQNQAAPITNRAGESKNPYVSSYTNSPVAWQPLDNDTIDRAKKEGKLIFLHIGYKACHYCRLMAIESFSNAECATVLNESFIPVVIDREERPDLDTIYMNYIQAVSNGGGWPENLFLTPELAPVFGGTYWPGPEASQRGTAENEEEAIDFLTIVKKVRNIWKEQETRCRIEASEIVGQLREFAAEGTIGTRSIVPSQRIAQSGWAAPVSAEAASAGERSSAASSDLDLDQLEEAYTHIAGTFDPVYGGFGLAPKFPTAPKLQFLLQLGLFPSAVQDVVGDAECKHATEIAFDTLRKIRDGALHDHIGETGFARCSVTADWSIPNFEKLVVDNALLLSLYLDAWKISGGQKTSEFYDVVIELAEYLSTSPITLPNGLFASSEAADSYFKKGDNEMREGAYYLWTRREFDSVIEASEKDASQVAAAYFNVLEDGNVDEDHDPNDDFINQNILRITKSPEELSKQINIPVEKIKQTIDAAKAALKSRRQNDRVRPELDAKAVTGWNGFVISSLAQTSGALKAIAPELSDKYLKVASAAAAFLQDHLWDSQNRTLYRIWIDGLRQTEAFADDYAYLIRGLLNLFDVTADEKHVEFADTLQKTQLSKFYDPAGAFFTTTASAPFSILRLKDGMDTSLPSTNAVAVTNLFQLGHLLNDEKFTTMARESINAFEVEMLQHPWLFPGLLAGVVTARLGLQNKRDAQVKFASTRQKA